MPENEQAPAADSEKFLRVDRGQVIEESAPAHAPRGDSDGKFFTEDDLAKARQQEKDKMYKRLETMQETVERLKKESQTRAEQEEARQREIQAQEAEEAERLRRAEEAELSAKELLAQRELEWKQQLEDVRNQVEQERALREREAEFARLTDYRSTVIREYSDRVAPELLDLIQGGTTEEIAQSAEDMAARTARILAQTQEAMQNARQQTPTSRVTAPAAGEDSGSNSRVLTPSEIRSMSMSEYAKQRQRLLGDGAKGPTNRGLFG